MMEEQRVALAETLGDGPLRKPLLLGSIIRVRDVAMPRQAGMYLRSLDQLRPSLEECTLWAALFVMLAGSAVPVVVNFAVRALGELDQICQLHPHEVFPALYLRPRRR
jgi:hypothetical protein